MEKQRQNKKPNILKILAIVLVLAAMETDFFLMVLGFAVMLAPIGLIGWLIYKAAGKKSGRTAANGKTTYQQPAFDECPKGLFCFHKDKGEHHVRRGKEIDPWDRPDIDIRKYQRNS